MSTTTNSNTDMNGELDTVSFHDIPPRSMTRKPSTSMVWPDLDLTSVPFPYLLDRMDRDKDATNSYVDFLRKQAKNEEKYCAGLAKCFDDRKKDSMLNNLQNIGRDILGDPAAKHVLDETESTAGYLHTINKALLDFAQARRQFAKFLDSKLCLTLEKHLGARNRTYDALKKERVAAARSYDDARRRIDNARNAKARCKREEQREETDLTQLGVRGEDPTSEPYIKQMKRYKESCQRSDRAAHAHAQEEKHGKECAQQLKQVYRKIARTVQALETDRIYDIVSLLSASIQLEKSTYEKRIQQLTDLETKLQVLDPVSDLRLFAHNCKVNEILKKSPAQTKQDRQAEKQRKAQATVLETQKYQVVVDKFLDAVFEWRRAGSEAQTHEEVQLAREMEGESVNELARKIISSFDHQSGRDVYIRGLNRQRGAQKDVGAYFDILAESLESLLDACVRNMDVDNCSMVMIMSQTFFRVVPDSPTGREYIVVGDTDPGTSNGDSSPEVGMGIDKQVQPPNDDNGENAPSNTNTKAPSPNRSREEAGKSQVVGEKEFMQARLQRHPVWQDITYWEETLQRGVRAEVERNCPRSPQDKVQYMYKQIVTAQLRGVVFNMAALRVPQSLTVTLIRRTAIAARMDDAEAASLLKVAAKVSKPKIRSRSRASSAKGTGSGVNNIGSGHAEATAAKGAVNVSNHREGDKKTERLRVDTRDSNDDDDVVEVITSLSSGDENDNPSFRLETTVDDGLGDLIPQVAASSESAAAATAASTEDEELSMWL